MLIKLNLVLFYFNQLVLQGNCFAAYQSALPLSVPKPAPQIDTPYKYSQFKFSNTPKGDGEVQKPASPGPSVVAEPSTTPTAAAVAKEPVTSSDKPKDWIDQILADPENRVAKDFHPPAILHPSVRFWMRIYTELSSLQTVVFDQKHPQIIYQVLDFTELQRTARNAVVYEILRERRIKATLARYRSAFVRLTRVPAKSRYATNPRLSFEERSILKGLEAAEHPHSLGEYLSNLKIQTGQKDAVVLGLSRADPYLKKMELIFETMGLPIEMTRLSLVESSFNTEATSRVGAVGVWQFMEPTAKMFMLVDRSSSVDERLSPLKATAAAARYLRSTLKQYKSWPIVVTAYNSGYRWLKRIPKADWTPPRIYSHFAPCRKNSGLGWAGRNYFPGLVAMIFAEAYRHHFYPNPRVQADWRLLYHTLTDRASLSELAIDNRWPIHTLAQLNPDVLDVDRTLPEGFLIAVPHHEENFLDLTQKNWIRQIKLRPSRPNKTNHARRRDRPVRPNRIASTVF